MERFLPGRHQIDSFGNGGFRLGGVSHQGTIVITPSGVRACDAKDVSELKINHVEALVIEQKSIDMVMFGTGSELTPLPKPIKQYLNDHGISYDLMSTNAAVRTYNVVQAEDRRVACILVAVGKANG